ncbi:BatA domain-containing protein [Alteromonas flava]|uniref:BatA domain-containing protein n=1 Tax=Alteromonas flava TaxID=2048003 RepID=UPI0013DCE462|nr:BatA domain-containing protein [Alteromonas flava]
MSWLNLQVNAPLALWAALSLLVPLIIHLISRSDLRRQLFAFTRLLPTRTIPIEHKLKLTERLLLLIRMLLLLALTLLLANVACSDQNAKPKTINIITPGWFDSVTQSEKKQVLSDFAQLQDASYWFLTPTPQAISLEQLNAESFESSGSDNNLALVINTWARLAALLAQLEQERQITADTKIAVYASNAADQFRGHKIASPQPIEWHIVDALGVASSSNLTFPSVTKRIAVVGDNPFIDTKLKTALRAIQDVLASELVITYLTDFDVRNLSEDVETVFLLSSDPLPLEIQNAFHQWSLGALERTVVKAEELAWQHRNFALQLAQRLFAQEIDQELWHRVTLTKQQIQHHGIASNHALPSIASSTAKPPYLVPVWLAFGIVFLLLAERVVSEYQAHRQPFVEGHRAE